MGNLIGGNIFNIFGVLGVASVATARGVAVSPVALQFDLPVMLAVAAVCLPIFLYRGAVVRWEGLLLIGITRSTRPISPSTPCTTRWSQSSPPSRPTSSSRSPA